MASWQAHVLYGNELQLAEILTDCGKLDGAPDPS